MSAESIRRARPDDVEFLAWATIAAARSHLSRGFWDLFAPDEAERLALVRALLLDEKASWWHWTIYWIAERDGRPAATLAGFDPSALDSPNDAVPRAAIACGIDGARLAEASARCAPIFECFHSPAPDAWIVESVATDPQARGGGFASALVRHVLAEGRAARHPVAQLSLFIGNTRAQRVYERAGFAITSEKRSPGFEAALGAPGVAQMTIRLAEAGQPEIA